MQKTKRIRKKQGDRKYNRSFKRRRHNNVKGGGDLSKILSENTKMASDSLSNSLDDLNPFSSGSITGSSSDSGSVSASGSKSNEISENTANQWKKLLFVITQASVAILYFFKNNEAKNYLTNPNLKQYSKPKSEDLIRHFTVPYQFGNINTSEYPIINYNPMTDFKTLNAKDIISVNKLDTDKNNKKIINLDSLATYITKKEKRQVNMSFKKVIGKIYNTANTEEYNKYKTMFKQIVYFIKERLGNPDDTYPENFWENIFDQKENYVMLTYLFFLIENENKSLTYQNINTEHSNTISILKDKFHCDEIIAILYIEIASKILIRNKIFNIFKDVAQKYADTKNITNNDWIKKQISSANDLDSESSSDSTSMRRSAVNDILTTAENNETLQSDSHTPSFKSPSIPPSVNETSVTKSLYASENNNDDDDDVNNELGDDDVYDDSLKSLEEEINSDKLKGGSSMSVSSNSNNLMRDSLDSIMQSNTVPNKLCENCNASNTTTTVDENGGIDKNSLINAIQLNLYKSANAAEKTYIKNIVTYYIDKNIDFLNKSVFNKPRDAEIKIIFKGINKCVKKQAEILNISDKYDIKSFTAKNSNGLNKYEYWSKRWIMLYYESKNKADDLEEQFEKSLEEEDDTNDDSVTEDDSDTRSTGNAQNEYTAARYSSNSEDDKNKTLQTSSMNMSTKETRDIFSIKDKVKDIRDNTIAHMNMYFLKLILEQKEKAYSDANMFCKINSVSKSINRSTRSASNTMDDSSSLPKKNSRMSGMSGMSGMDSSALSDSNSRMSGMSGMDSSSLSESSSKMSGMISPSLSESSSRMSKMSGMDSSALSDSNSRMSKMSGIDSSALSDSSSRMSKMSGIDSSSLSDSNSRMSGMSGMSGMNSSALSESNGTR